MGHMNRVKVVDNVELTHLKRVASDIRQSIQDDNLTVLHTHRKQKERKTSKKNKYFLDAIDVCAARGQLRIYTFRII